jgi:ribokinase
MIAAEIALFAGDVSLDTTVVVDHVPEPDEKVHATGLVEDFGGVVANAAVACRLAGSAAALLAQLGDDLAADACRGRLRERDVTLRTPEPVAHGTTSRALITLDSDGEKRLVLAPGVSLYPSLAACEKVDLTGVAWLHTAVYDLAAATVLISRCRALGIPWSADLEPATLRAGPAVLLARLGGAAAVFVNTRAARLLGEHPADRLFAAGVQQVIFTDGPDGARWSTPEYEVSVEVPTSAEPVIDTTGAGDCLAGSFIARSLRGHEPLSALRYAVTAASLSCRRLGGQSSYANAAEVHALAAAMP